MAFDEKKHPRDSDGKFTDGNGGSERNKIVAAISKYSSDPTRDMEYSNLPSAKRLADNIPKKAWENMPAEQMDEPLQGETPNGKTVVKVNLDSDIQREFDRATPKERQKIAFDYIMRNLRGKYPMGDGRIVAIERVGADKMSHTLVETKIRVLPELAQLITTGEFEGIVKSDKGDGMPHSSFTSFAYYKVWFQIGNDRYIGLLNVGIRADGSSTLYDLNPFDKQ